MLSSTIYMPNFRPIGPFNLNRNYRGGGRGGGGEGQILPPFISICKKPGLCRVNIFHEIYSLYIALKVDNTKM